MADAENVPLTEGLLATMRRAAQYAIELGEPFISPRALLLALLEDPAVGFKLQRLTSAAKVRNADVEFAFSTAQDTLAFKTPDGRSMMWLSKESFEIFFQGAKRVAERYSPRELALGIAAEAVQLPGILAAIRVEPGALMDAV